MVGNLVSTLRGIQKAEGLSDMEMAKRLGCSRQLYQMTRTGKIPLGKKILTGISAAFPELQQDVIYFLSNDANEIPLSANRSPLKQPLGALRRGLNKLGDVLLGKIWKLYQ